MGIGRGIRILWQRLTTHGLRITVLWTLDHAVRIVTGAPMRRTSEISQLLHVGGQFRRRGVATLQRRGICAIVNMRIEWDDRTQGVDALSYLHLPTIDDDAPTIAQLRHGAEFIAAQVENHRGVYIHCGSGIGRAPTMVAAFLIASGMSEQEAWQTIWAKRPFIRPTPVQLEQIKIFAQSQEGFCIKPAQTKDKENAMDPRLNLIFSRRSIRTYADEPVEAADVQSLLEAAMAAPSASNRKPWHFVVTSDKETLQDLADANPYGKMLSEAGLALVVCGDPAISEWWVQDCTAATQNILLAASGLGLGAVWIGCHGKPEREQAIRNILSIPASIGVLSLLSIGHPAETKEARTQYDEARVHQGQW